MKPFEKLNLFLSSIRILKNWYIFPLVYFRLIKKPYVIFLTRDNLQVKIILDKIMSIPDDEGFILDGFPRTPHQADALEKKLAAESRILDKVVHLDVSEPELLRRLGGRYICRSCRAPHAIGEGGEGKKCDNCGGELYQRDDDAPVAVKKRIEVYNAQTIPVLDFYRDRGVLVDISGDGTVDEINKQVLAALNG